MTPVLAGTPVLETERLTLRAPGRDDWPAFNAFIAGPRADEQPGRQRRDRTCPGHGRQVERGHPDRRRQPAPRERGPDPGSQRPQTDKKCIHAIEQVSASAQEPGLSCHRMSAL